MIKNRNILITGGAGFIGSNLFKQLMQQDNNITIIDNFNNYYLGKEERLREIITEFNASQNYNIIRGDLLDKTKKSLFWVAPAQTICNVAQGKIDGFIDMGCSTFGHSAAALILQNAGGEIANYDKTTFDHTTKGGLFLNGKIDSFMLK